MDRDAVDDVLSSGRRHDARVHIGGAERPREVAQVKLDPALPREEPVADERDAH